MKLNKNWKINNNYTDNIERTTYSYDTEIDKIDSYISNEKLLLIKLIDYKFQFFFKFICNIGELCFCNIFDRFPQSKISTANIY